MKTAVLLSGQLRCAKKSFYSINRNLIKKYNADLFISTWYSTSNLIAGLGHHIEDDLTIQELISLYKPTESCIENFDICPNGQLVADYKLWNKHAYDGGWIESVNIVNTFYQYYRRFKGFNLIEQHQKLNNFKYDCVIVSRFDVSIKDILLIEPEPNTIYIPVGPNADSPAYHFGGIRDLYALGNYDVIKVYCELYQSLKPYHDSGHGLHPESILRTHLEIHNIQIRRFPIFSRIRDIDIW